MAFNDQGQVTFHGCTDLVVLSTDPEYADVDNPEGNIYGCAPYVVAEDESGNRKVLSAGKAIRGEQAALDVAEALAARLTARLANLGKLPVGFATKWRESRPCYGSDAYVTSGQEYEDAVCERQQEERGWA